MYSTVHLVKETETEDTVVYKFGPKDNLTGKIMINKKGDPSKVGPIEVESVVCERPDFFFKRAAMRLSRYMKENRYPDKEFIATGL